MAVATVEPTPPTWLAGRYRLGEELGRGALGVVVRAWDLAAEREVALKWLHDQVDLATIRREFAVAARLRHPHIVEVYDFAARDDAPAFFTMALLDAVPFDEACRDRSTDTVLSLAADLLSALAYLDGRGLLHGDLKPGNVLVDPDGRVQLVDFGLAAADARDGLSGTPAYLAPEVVQGQPRDVRSELYAVGVLLYEAFTGHNPFDADQIVACLERHLEHEPPPLHHVRDDVNMAVAGFVERLLKKAPERRFQSARAALDALEDLRAAASDDARAPIVCVPSLTGLADADAAISDIVAMQRDGRGGFVTICGPSGCGRSRLAGLLRRRTQLAGAAVGVAALRGDDNDALRIVRAIDMALGAPVPAEQADEQALQPAIARLAAADEPVTLIIDDADAGGPAIIQALSELSYDVQANALCMVLTLSSSGDDTADLLLRASVAAVRRGHGRRLDVRPLSPQESARALVSAIGGQVDHDSLAGPLHRASAGVPRDMLTLLAHFAASNALHRDQGRWVLDERQIDAVAGGPPLKDMLSARLSSCSPAARDALTGLVVLEAGAASAVAAVVEGSRETIAEGLNELVAARLIEHQGGGANARYRPAHAALVEVVRDRMDATRWCALHRRAIDVAGRGSAPIEQIARHALEARWVDQAPALVTAAARKVERAQRPELALTLVTQLAALLDTEAPGGDAHRQALFDAGRLQHTLGRYDAALESLARAEDVLDAGDDARRAALVRCRIEALARLGRTEEARAAVDMLSSLREAISDNAERARNDVVAARVLRLVGALDEARASCETALAGLGDTPDPALAAELLRELATLDWQQGRVDDAIGHAQGAVTLAEHAGDDRGHAEGLMALATSYRTGGRYTDALPLYQQAAERFRALGALASLGKAENNAGVCAYLLGRVEDAADRWRAAIRIAELTGEYVEQAILQVNLGFMYLERGALDQAERSLVEALALAEQADAVRLRISALGNLGEVRLGQQAYDAAHDCFMQAVALAEGVDARSDVLENRRRLAELKLAMGDHAGAERLADTLITEATERGLGGELAQLHRIVGVAATRCEHFPEARAALAASRTSQGGDADTIDAARLVLAQAELALAQGEPGDARVLVNEAIERFEKHGASWYLEQARALAAQVAESEGSDGGAVDASGMVALIAALSEIWDVDAAMERALGAVLAATGAEHATLYLMPTAHHDGVRVSRMTESDEMWVADVGDFSRTVAERVLDEGQPLCLQHIEDDQDVATAASIMAMNVRSILCVPVPLESATGGLIYADSRVHTGTRFKNAVPQVQAIGQLLGLALDRIRLRERFRSQSDIVSVVAHELRTPLTSILGFGELAEARTTRGQSTELDLLVEVVNQQGDRMKRLISDVQALGRAWRYTLENARAIAPRALLGAATAELGPQAVAAKVRLVVEAERDLPFVLADLSRVRQVLTNLVTNAFRYTPENTTVTVAACHEPFRGMVAEKRAVRFSVSDCGPGLTEKDAARVFEKFNRGSSPRGEGSGLGLNIAQTIVMAHGGRIWADPDADGATFHFTLPVTED